MKARYASAALLLATTALASCAAGPGVESAMGTPMDAVCDPRYSTLPAPTDTFQVGWATFAVARGWASATVSAPRLELRRIGSTLIVREGEPVPVPLGPPLRNANVRCELTRRDTTVIITGSRERGTDFSVSAWWETEADGPILQLTLVTNSAAELRRIRGTIESVRFPIDTMRIAKRRKAK